MSELRRKFQEDRKFRRQVYLGAAVMTVINIMVLCLFMETGTAPLSVLAILVTASCTLALYYISDGIVRFVKLIRVISKIASAFTKGMTFLTGWAIGLGVLIQTVLQILIPVCVVGGVLIFGLLSAYMLPAVFMPLFYCAGMIFKQTEKGEPKAPVQGMEAAEPAADNVDWDRIYSRVIMEVKR